MFSFYNFVLYGLNAVLLLNGCCLEKWKTHIYYAV